jgi:hypothetical protein
MVMELLVEAGEPDKVPAVPSLGRYGSGRYADPVIERVVKAMVMAIDDWFGVGVLRGAG